MFVNKAPVGSTFGRWTVTGDTSRGWRKKTPVRCVCGNEAAVDYYGLLGGHSRSCGCLRIDAISGPKVEHSRKAYQAWRAMTNRCEKPDTEAYPHYGGRGVRVCQAWKTFAGFYADMGEPPSTEHSLERHDVNGDYGPDNCCWATRKEQARDKRNTAYLEYLGRRACIADWAEETGIPLPALRLRRRRGWSDVKLLTTPLNLTRSAAVKKVVQDRRLKAAQKEQEQEQKGETQ